MPSDLKAARQAAQVLAGDLRYDGVSSAAQRLVREEWQVRIDERRSKLNLEAEFRSRGRSWSELNEAGRVVQRR